jgi:hypothetical protein
MQTCAQDSLHEHIWIAESEGRWIGFTELRVCETLQQILQFRVQTAEYMSWYAWTGTVSEGIEWLCSSADHAASVLYTSSFDLDA